MAAGESVGGVSVGGGGVAMSGEVSLEVEERVAHLVIERPAKRNALTLSALAELAGHVRAIAADPSIGAVVVAGRDGHFSAGLDLADLASLTTAGLDEAQVASVQAVFDALEDLEVPVVAAIEGVCLGGGLQLALACHLRAVAPGARLAVLETRWGLVPDLGATWRLPRLVGPARATELILTARELGAEEALACGLAEIALPAGDVRAAAHDLAARLAAGPEALRLVPRLVRDAVGSSRADAHTAAARAQVRLVAGTDPAEAFRAVAEGRPPRFRTRP